MEPQKYPFTDWLTAQCAECVRRREALNADLRTDEALFERIRENMYGIFRTVYTTAAETKATPQEVHLVFLQRLEDIPANWKIARDLAQRNGDEYKACIEQLKLDTVDHIRAEYLKQQEVTV